MRRSGVLLTMCGGAACAMAQGTITYYWEVSGTGSNTATIGPGEIASLELWAMWEPSEDILGFAGTIYDILGIENWGTGEVRWWRNRLGVGWDGPPDSENNITGIESFQLPPLFNPLFNYDHPLLLYEIGWEPDDYSPRRVRVSDGVHWNNDLYLDELGSSVSYDQAPSEGATIHIVPAPASVAAMLCAGVMTARRRRRIAGSSRQAQRRVCAPR